MKYFLIIFCILLCLQTKAQIDTTGRSDLASLFQNLNAANIPTGYLMEWGTDMADKDDLNGVITDSNFVNNLDIVRMVYADVYSARYSAASPAMISPDALNAAINAVQSSGNLVMVYGEYAVTNPNSINNGWLTYNRGRLTETGTGSPYTTQQVWAAYPTKSVYNNEVSLHFDPSLYFNNTNVSIATLLVDFGNGYTALAPNGTVNHTYTDSSGLKVVKIKAVLSNGQQMETQMVVEVKVSFTNTANRYTLANLDLPDFTVPAQPGVHAGCRVFLRRSIATPANQILKPFIVVEGLDISSALPDIRENFDINDIINEIGLARNRFGTPVRFFDEWLDEVGNYDLLFVDWGNGVGDIPGNAVALEAVIDWVNQQKAASNSTQQNVIMGISMGGLISRYCLADMVKRTPRKATGTRLLLTMDSPHQGAYVPLAFQHLIMALPDVNGPLGIRLGSIMNNTLDQVRNNLLLAPAPQQQLTLLASNANGGVMANTFLNSVYRPMITFPAGLVPEYDFRAISNGSQCGIPVMQPGENLVSGTAGANLTGAVITLQVLLSLVTPIPWYVVTKLKYHTELNANSLNGNANHEILFYKLKREGKLFFVINNNKTFVEIHRNEPAFNSIPWESLPGGTQSLGNRLGVGGNGPASIQDDWNFLSPSFLGYNYSVTIAPQWGFVPVTSALDIINPSTQNNQYIFPVQGTNGSTSSRYIAQEFSAAQGGFNVDHTDFTARNSRWIFNEMENNIQNFDCTYDCPLSYNTTISGPNLVCSSASYTIDNLNALEVADVSVSPIGIATANLNANNTISVTAVPNASGFITLILAVRIPNCNASAPITKTIYVGKPQPVNSILAFNTVNSGCAIIQNLKVDRLASQTSYTWFSACTIPFAGSFLNKGTGIEKTIYQLNPCDGEETGQYKTRVDATNTCGTTTGTLEKLVDFTYTTVYDQECLNPPTSNNDYYFITIAPNPVTTSAIIKIKYLPPPNPPSPAPSQLMTKLMLYTSGNQLLFSYQLSNLSQYTLNTSSLTSGSYRLLVQSSSGQWLQATLIK